MKRTLKTVALWLASAALAAVLPPTITRAQDAARWTDVPRVVVVGDVHGAYAQLVELLETTGVVGPELRWTGGTTHVVSLGDLLDRGADVRRVLDLVMRLQREAAAAGGHLHVLLGNHELMNLLGDLRYVSPEDYAAFAVDETAEQRAAAYAEFAAAAAGDTAATRGEFAATFPPGYFARQAAFSPGGVYGEWLLSLPAIVVVNDTAFVHGGLPQVVADTGLDVNATVAADLARYLALREQLMAQGVLPVGSRQGDLGRARAAIGTADAEVAAEIEEFVALGDAPELGTYGPFWYRGSVYCKPLLEEPTLDAALERLGAVRAVVGHTPVDDRRVRALYGGKLIMLDTGMLTDYFQGRPSALLLESGRVEVQYLRPTEQGAVESGRLLAYGRTEAQLVEALEAGVATAVEQGEDLPWSVTLRHEGADIGAVFYPQDRDRAADLELAAAALDDLLGTALIAPTVSRTIEGQQGALQLRFPDAISEADRVARGLGFSGWCPMGPQLQLVYAFDLLMGNRGRTAANALLSNDLTDLTLTDHRGAFGTERTLPARLDPSRLSTPAPLVARLRALEEAELDAALGAWLDSRRIRALLARRDQLLQN